MNRLATGVAPVRLRSQRETSAQYVRNLASLYAGPARDRFTFCERSFSVAIAAALDPIDRSTGIALVLPTGGKPVVARDRSCGPDHSAVDIPATIGRGRLRWVRISTTSYPSHFDATKSPPCCRGLPDGSDRCVVVRPARARPRRGCRRQGRVGMRDRGQGRTSTLDIGAMIRCQIPVRPGRGRSSGAGPPRATGGRRGRA